MTEAEKEKRKIRASKEWEDFREQKYIECEKKDIITGKKLYKGWNNHHRDLREENYSKLIPEHFLPCNKKTHNFLHWLFPYFIKDPAIIDRIKAEMEIMQKINEQ